MVSKKGVKKEFSRLADRIEDLKELEEKLDSLDTRGFAKEDTYIRSRLKDVNAVPLLRKKIKVLEQNILNRNLKAGKGRLGSELLAEHQALKDEISGIDRDLDRIEKKFEKKRRARKQLKKDEVSDARSIPDIEREIRLIKDAVDSVRRRAGRKQLSKSEVSDVEDIPAIEGAVNEIVGKMDSFAKTSYLKRRLGEIEKRLDWRVAKREIGKLKALLDYEKKLGNYNFAVLDNKIDSFLKEFEIHEEGDRRRLSKISTVLKDFKEEFENVLDNELAEYCEIEEKLDHSQDYVKKEIPKFEHELAEFKREFEDHLHSSNVPIDTGVGMLVDSRFDDFVSAIKAGVTGRMKDSIRKQQKIFNEKLDEFKDRLREEFDMKVETELRREVEEKFDHELKEALNLEKKKLYEKWREEIAGIREEKERVLRKLRETSALKLENEKRVLQKQMRERFAKEINEEREKIRKKMYDKIKKEVIGRLKLEKQKIMELFGEQYKKAESILDGEIDREVKKLTQESNRDGKAVEEKFVETKDGDIIAEVRRVAIVRKPKRGAFLSLDGEENSLRKRLKELMGYDPEAGMPDRDQSFYDR